MLYLSVLTLARRLYMLTETPPSWGNRKPPRIRLHLGSGINKRKPSTRTIVSESTQRSYAHVAQLIWLAGRRRSAAGFVEPASEHVVCIETGFPLWVAKCSITTLRAQPRTVVSEFVASSSADPQSLSFCSIRLVAPCCLLPRVV